MVYLDNILLMMIKPSGLPYIDNIIDRIQNNGFIVIYTRKKILTDEDIEFLYDDVFQKIRLTQTDKANEYIRKHYEYMQSDTVVLLAVFYIGSDDAFKVALRIKGSKPFSKDCEPGSIRYDFGRDGPLNSFHASSSKEEALRELKRFFPEIVDLYV